jgi:hypothetical protein
MQYLGLFSKQTQHATLTAAVAIAAAWSEKRKFL